MRKSGKRIDNNCDQEPRNMLVHVESRDVKFGIEIGAHWPQIGQIWDFYRSVSVHFGSASQNY